MNRSTTHRSPQDSDVAVHAVHLAAGALDAAAPKTLTLAAAVLSRAGAAGPAVPGAMAIFMGIFAEKLIEKHWIFGKIVIFWGEIGDCFGRNGNFLGEMEHFGGYDWVGIFLTPHTDLFVWD